MASDRCRICHRPLKRPESRQRGIGPVCEKKQVAKADYGQRRIEDFQESGGC